MKNFLIRNLCNGPRDYPLKDGSSIYIGAKGRSTGVQVIKEKDISEVITLAAKKNLISIEEVSENE